jgi:hypothetical protein
MTVPVNRKNGANMPVILVVSSLIGMALLPTYYERRACQVQGIGSKRRAARDKVASPSVVSR